MKKIAVVTLGLSIAVSVAVKAQNNNSLSTTGITSGGMAYNLTNKEDTKGSQFLFDTWVKGSMADAKGNAVNADGYSFNYDKLGGALLLSQDKQTAIAVDKDRARTFILYDKADKALKFEYVPVIDAKLYCEVLSAGAKYKIYKLTKTKFIKADYKNDGISSSGNKYDEFTDEFGYYVADAKGGAPQKISLKNKAIKQAFAADADKVKAYFDAHKDDKINDAFLAGLGDALNQ
ncbi:hypothetical protein [Mucilaginibacter flavus]|uniref:hypothetical protein n=1 Tax=Mucilaginibacter flavus TaxID=931504 RepID=UPI0025B541AA|nr:hypothetical protein [Mucilaginibacter flavus]MDN3582366.1 hypothetical protein [Mucilaginibacter flavus]